jgi:hypothetical protein
MPRIKIKTMDLKKKFGISELKTEYAYSKHLQKEVHKCGNNFADYALDVLNHSFDYSEWLNTTKLTTQLVESLFEWTKEEYPYLDKYTIGGYVVWNDGGMWIFDTKNDHFQTLADLARLTAAKPILLA